MDVNIGTIMFLRRLNTYQNSKDKYFGLHFGAWHKLDFLLPPRHRVQVTKQCTRLAIQVLQTLQWVLGGEFHERVSFQGLRTSARKG